MDGNHPLLLSLCFNKVLRLFVHWVKLLDGYTVCECVCVRTLHILSYLGWRSLFWLDNQAPFFSILLYSIECCWNPLNIILYIWGL